MIAENSDKRPVPAQVCAWCGRAMSREFVSDGYQTVGVCTICRFNGLSHPDKMELDYRPNVPWVVLWFALFATASAALIVWIILP